jgi:uncharacterized protein
VRLVDNGGGTTLLSYTANAQVGGKLAQIGARVIDLTAKQMADQFFGKFIDKASANDAVAARRPSPIKLMMYQGQ